MPQKIIIALDYDKQTQALHLVEQLDPRKCALKVGSELFTHFGLDFVKKLISMNFKVFLDLKFHDIPNTVSKACKAAADLGVWMLNVHASGGAVMMEHARQALEHYGEDRPLLIAVTVLTSFAQEDLSHIGIDKPIMDHVKHLAILSHNSGMDGVVCSGFETRMIKAHCGEDFIAVTPGIRLNNDSKDDQNRIMTPKLAIQEGSDYLVVGRPITQSTTPLAVLNQILEDIQYVQ